MPFKIGAKRPASAPVRRVVDALNAGLPFKASVTAERIPGTALYRVYVVSETFKNMALYERQDHAWRVVNQSVQPADQNLVSMIVTATPAELQQAPPARRGRVVLVQDNGTIVVECDNGQRIMVAAGELALDTSASS